MTETSVGYDKAFEKLTANTRETDNIAVFIDGYGTLEAAKCLNFRIDWLIFRDLMNDVARVKLLNVYLSSNIKSDCRKLADWFMHNGFNVTLTEGESCIYEQNIEGKVFNKFSYNTGYNINMATDILSIANKVDRIFLFTANKEFASLVLKLRSDGIPVTVISNSLNKLRELKANKKIENISDVGVDLIRSASEFVELHDIHIGIKKEE